MSLGGPEQLVVLPDTESGARLAEAMSLDVLSTYPSGRPLAVGHSDRRRYWQFEQADRSVTLLGSLPSPVPSAVAHHVASADSVAAVDSARCPGSFYLVVRVGNTIRIQGTVSGLRRVFWTSIEGGIVVASDASLLARLGHRGVDGSALPLWLVSPHAPHPLSELTAWDGVHAVPPGSFLQVTQGEPAVRRYFVPPRPFDDLASGIELLRERLEEAVATRCRSGAVVTCDASGGIDSTALLALAVEHMPDVTAFTTGPTALFPEERRWAKEAIDHLGVQNWVTTDPANFPTVFDGIGVSDLLRDAPFAGEPVKARSSYIASQLADTVPGSPVTHLAGHLGDELFASGVAHLRDSSTRAPRKTAARIGLIHSRTRIPRRTLWRWALDREPLRSAYARFLRTGTMPLGWHSYPLRFPPWVLPPAISALADVAPAPDLVEPMGRTAEQHEAVARVVVSGEMLRHEAEIMATHGVQLELPFGDDRVLDAALRLPVGELHDPAFIKPALRQCVGDLLPPSIAARTTKVDNTEAIWQGLRKHAEVLREMTDNMLLETNGIIDAERFRSTLFGPHPPDLAPMSLWRTLAVEAWLRATADSRLVPPPTHTTPQTTRGDHEWR